MSKPKNAQNQQFVSARVAVLWVCCECGADNLTPADLEHPECRACGSKMYLVNAPEIEFEQVPK